MPKDALREPMLWRAAHRKVRAKARQSGAEMSDRAPKVYLVLRGTKPKNATGRRFCARSHENREPANGAVPLQWATIFSEGHVPRSRLPRLLSGTAGDKPPPYGTPRWGHAPTTKKAKSHPWVAFCGCGIYAREIRPCRSSWRLPQQDYPLSSQCPRPYRSDRRRRS